MDAFAERGDRSPALIESSLDVGDKVGDSVEKETFEVLLEL